MGNSQSRSNRNIPIDQSEKQTKSLTHPGQNPHFLQVDPNLSPSYFKAARRRHSSVGNSSFCTKSLRNKHSASSVLSSRLKYASADVELNTDASALLESNVGHDKGQFAREPPGFSTTTTTFGRNHQFTSLPCSPPSHLAYCSPPISDGREVLIDEPAEAAFVIFLKQYPRKHYFFTTYSLIEHLSSEYRSTWILDTLRRTDYTRLSRTSSQHCDETETYVDYMGGSLYPESLIRVHTEFLIGNVLGNTHSLSAR